MANFNININARINQPPIVGDGEKFTEYGQAIAFSREDFTTNTNPPYSDPEGDLPLNLKILSLPLHGSLKVDGVAVTVNQIISFIDIIDEGLLTYEPGNSSEGVDFQFAISDVGSQQYSS